MERDILIPAFEGLIVYYGWLWGKLTDEEKARIWNIVNGESDQKEDRPESL